MKQRPPIVTVLGHVDHGKTTLLDTIRKSRVADREAGGITQGIGASLIETSEGKITFIDTPGHEAFSQMREHGAKISDLAVLVVAADDGPMPQTEEALKYIKQSKTPMIVAFTKVDLPSANFERAISEMEKREVYFESRGGDTPFVQVSAKEGLGIEELLEMIHLVAGINDVSGDPEESFEAIVIETNVDKRGPVVSVVVRKGTLRRGDEIFFGQEKVKIKGLFDENGKGVSEALPGEPVVIMGFTELPYVGATLSSTQYALTISNSEDKEIRKDQLPLILKVRSAGSIDAIKYSLTDETFILSASVGEVTETDVFMAKASSAVIFAFETKVSSSVKKLAENEGVDLYEFNIIYKLLEKIEDVLSSSKDKILGKLEILAIFPYNRLQIAGGKVLDGRIAKGDRVRVVRGERELGVSKIASVRSEKKEIDVAKAGQECGVLIKPQIEFAQGDTIVSIEYK